MDVIFHILSSHIFELIETLFITPGCFKKVKVYVNGQDNHQYLAFCEDDRGMMRYFLVYNVPSESQGSTKLQIREATSSEIQFHLLDLGVDTYRISPAAAAQAEDRQRRQARWAPHGRRRQSDYDDLNRRGGHEVWYVADDFEEVQTI